jgi:hypothetical protein
MKSRFLVRSLMTLAIIGFAFFVVGCAKVVMPTISPPDGTDLSSGAVSVTISTLTTGASIYYTRDGTAPDTSSTLYTVPFTVNPNHAPPEVVKAFAVKWGMPDSDIAVATYSWGW